MEVDEISNLFRVSKTVYQMLRDRGYIISEKKLNQTKEQFKESYDNTSKNKLNILVEKRESEDDDFKDPVSRKLIVYFSDIDKLN